MAMLEIANIFKHDSLAGDHKHQLTTTGPRHTLKIGNDGPNN